MNPIVALIIANIIWGVASPIFKFALLNIPPFTLAFIRFFLASLILSPFLLKRWQKMSLKDNFEICLSALFGITINIAFFFSGLEKSASINAPVIASAGPVFIFFLSVLLLHERAKFNVFAGMIISLIGVLIVILSPIFLDGRPIVIGEVEGNLFFVLATLGAVINTIMNKKILERINALQLTFISFLFGSLTFVPLMYKELQRWEFRQLNINGWTGIIFGVLFSSALAYYLFNLALEKIKAQEVGLFTYIDPVAAILVAAPLIGEYPNLYFFIGSLLVFGGIFMAEKRIHWHPIHLLKVKRQKSRLRQDYGGQAKLKT